MQPFPIDRSSVVVALVYVALVYKGPLYILYCIVSHCGLVWYMFDRNTKALRRI